MHFWEQTSTFALYDIKCFVFITDMEFVYCAAGNGVLSKTDYVSSLKGIEKLNSHLKIMQNT
jgi:hypothetical protein